MVYSFDVVEGYLRCTNAKKMIISDSVNYHTAHFTFDDALIGYSKSAIFTNTKTEVSIIQPLDGEDNCVIPFEPLVGEGYLDVCIKATLNTSTLYTEMPIQIVILQSGKTDVGTPTPPTQSVYDEILEIANSNHANIIPEPIDDLVTTYDNYMCTVGQIKEYVNSKLGGA